MTTDIPTTPRRPPARTNGWAAMPGSRAGRPYHDLMDLEPACRDLRAAHGSTRSTRRDKLHWFLSGWLGGPDLYIEALRPSAAAHAPCPSRSASGAGPVGALHARR